jgi:hypothetical protein
MPLTAAESGAGRDRKLPVRSGAATGPLDLPCRIIPIPRVVRTDRALSALSASGGISVRPIADREEA